MWISRTALPGLALTLGLVLPAQAGPANVLDVQIDHKDGNTYSVSATIRHNDEGWDHYADKFEVLDPDGKLLGLRTLMHPHVNEQPFTRSLNDVEIPEDVERVIVRAHDSEHGYGGAEMTVDVPR